MTTVPSARMLAHAVRTQTRTWRDSTGGELDLWIVVDLLREGLVLVDGSTPLCAVWTRSSAAGA
eukprot:12465696-Alexandrium_andersonii.AAC.1